MPNLVQTLPLAFDMPNLIQMLPLAFVMIAGQQIASAGFFAKSVDWRRNSVAYIAGVALSMMLFVTAAYLIAKGVRGSRSSYKDSALHVIDAVVLTLLLFAAVYVFLKRKESEPPKWMGKLQTGGPKLSLGLGTGLLGVFPIGIVTSVTVGSHAGRDNDPWWYTLPVVLLALFLLALPMLLVLLLGEERGQTALPNVRGWMTANSWLVSEGVILLFIGLTLKNLAGGVCALHVCP